MRIQAYCMVLYHEDYPHLAALCFMLITCLNEASLV